MILGRVRRRVAVMTLKQILDLVGKLDDAPGEDTPVSDPPVPKRKRQRVCLGKDFTLDTIEALFNSLFKGCH